ncbi:Gfo/Idh/MocA family protein [Sphingomonas sp. CFBP 8760]|uniref:Gfo/Idh/MocA family protein n=1 Tax=Sphingomonas sp. CFBP 8760 TaxID=2775282 RepID=UPI0017869690|nr:Gfo/Idh/MocA family oxidoreductase [Sphingomonas sp. CFBP 8760]MBD8547558.1 Gfo/Idh/MocA family oxidoreductase [Sphingomonas sp. CFBP 8760]
MTDAIDRRLMLMGGAVAGLALGGKAVAQRLPPPSAVDTGRVEGGKVAFPEWRGEADPKSAPPPAPLPPERRVGFAVVALGRLTLEELLPAFAECKNAKLVALVSGSPDKLRTVAAQYGIAPDQCYDYAGFDRLRDNPAVQAVYIVLPNGMHREYVERAARAGKHVLCEKPMANSSAEARSMIAACAKANVKLMIAYRIQYEPYNQRARRFVQEGTFGRLVGATMTNTQTVAPDGAQQWRHKKALAGGGTLPDIGLYLVNTARFLTGQEPVEVFARQYSPPGDPRYAEVEETVAFTMRFPSEFMAQCLTSYGARDDKAQVLNFARATVQMPSAYRYRGQELYVAQNVGGADVRQQVNIPPKNQFAAEIDHMADCIIADRRPRTPGEEGLQDHVVMEAIYESAQTGRPVALKRYDGIDVFRGPMPTT